MFTEADQSFYDGLDVSLGPGVIEDLAATIARGLDRIGDDVLPRLSHVTQEQIDSDWTSLTFHVHIATDLVLAIDLCGPPREIDATQVIEGVRSVWPGRDRIAAAAEVVLCALERCLHESGAERADTHLIGVALAPVGTWPDADTPALVAEIDILGDDLRPRRQRMHFSSVAADGDRFREVIATQRRRIALRQFLIERGATGSMDQLTWAAVMALPEPEQVLRRLGRHQRVWPSDALYLGWQEGRLLSSGDGFQGLSWNGSHIEVTGEIPPETTLAAAVGRPVTALCDHRLLSPDMIVSRAWRAPMEDGATKQVLVIEIEQVDHLFSAPLAKVDPNPLNFRSRTGLNGPDDEEGRDGPER